MGFNRRVRHAPAPARTWTWQQAGQFAGLDREKRFSSDFSLTCWRSKFSGCSTTRQATNQRRDQSHGEHEGTHKDEPAATIDGQDS